jgi:eukaryotic-like serine/threonine-protein kinase
MSNSSSTSHDADRHLLFGVLALKADFLDAARFAEACSAWAAGGDVAFADLLIERGWLTAADRVEVEHFLDRKLKKHNGDTKAVLAEVASDDTRRILAGVAAPAVQQTLATIPPADLPLATSPISGPSSEYGRYSLTNLHAMGGLGQVWVAHDADLGRDVALKELLGHHADNPALLARFLEEAKITGQLEHPNIVPVYELARRAGERSFYTMRFIRGRTFSAAIKDYHKKRSSNEAELLEFRELLNQFVAVCNAVGYAHSRGVLHRDLKPVNVVLGDYGEVIVLDWGLAKVKGTAETRANERPISVDPDTARQGTMQGQVLGTPSYMPPEQAEGRLDMVDERSDVYSLGASLYELLVGEPPFSGPDTLAILMQVMVDPPVSPRRKVLRTAPALEAICMKALAKKPEERYTRALDLAQDVQRWLADQPVSAYPEPLATRLARWGRQHKPWIAGAASLLVAAVLALTAGAVVLSRANARTREQRDLAQDNFREAERQRTKFEVINRFLTDNLLAAARPEEKGRDITMRQALDAAVPKISETFNGRPDIEASIRKAFGETYKSLGLYARAEPHLQRSLELYRQTEGAEQPATLEAVDSWAMLLKEEGKLKDAESLLRQNLEDRRRLLPEDDPDILVSVNHLGALLFDKGQIAEAEPLFTQNLQDRIRVLGPDHLRTLESANNLGMLLFAKGKLAEAENLFRSNWEASRRLLRDDHPDLLEARNNLGVVLKTEGKLAEAEPLYRQNLEAYRRVLGPDHAYTLAGRNNLAGLLRAAGKPAEAEQLFRQNLEAYRRVLGPDHASTMGTLNNLAIVLQARNKLADAEEIFRESVAARQRALGPEHLDTLNTRYNLAVLLVAENKWSEGESMFRDILPLQRRVLPAGHIAIARTLQGLGEVLVRQNKSQEAEGLLTESLTVFREALPKGHPDIATTELFLGECLKALKRYAEAEPLLLDSYEALARAKGAYQMHIPRSRQQLVQLYEAWGKLEEANRWRGKQSESAQPTRKPENNKP